MTTQFEYEMVTQTTATLIDNMAPSDDMVAMAAWVSFDRDSEERLKNKKQQAGLINFLMREKHMSPFEHGQFTFKVDVPLYVAREFQRHRTMSFNEVSGRYTEMKHRFMTITEDRPLIQQGKPGDYYFVKGSPDQYDLIRESDERVAKFLIEEYHHRLDIGVAKEVARNILPLNLMTQYYASVNARNLMHFLDLRTDSHALYEIRQVARQMEVIFAEKMPMTYAAWIKSKESDL